MFGKILSIHIIVGIFSIISYADNSALELINKWQENQRIFEKAIIKGETREQLFDSAQNSTRLSGSINELRIDGKRFDLLITRYPELSREDEKLTPRAREDLRLIWDGEEYYEITFPQDSRQEGSGFVNMNHNENHEIMLQFSGASLLGVFQGDKKSFDEIFEEANTAKIRGTMEMINGSKCYVIDAETSSGKYSVWIDPEHGYNIVQAEVHKTDSDIYFGKPMKDLYPRTRPEGLPDGMGWQPQPQLVSFSFNLKGVKFDKINDVWVSIAGQWESITEDENGKIEKYNKTFKMQTVDFNPDFESIGAFIPDIPNGTRVFVENQQKIYFWQDGKITPLDNEPISNMDKPLHDFNGIKIDLTQNQIEKKMILVCFFDIEQRPSRNCITQLNKSAQELKSKDIEIFAVQISKIEQSKLDEWLKENGISFPVGMIEKDEEKTRFNWGVRALPWLILTDKEHIVQAEGFAIDQLDEKLEGINSK